MPKLTDTQLVILSAAAERDGGTVLPMPKSLKVNKAAATKTIKNLINRGLISEQPAARDDEVWREAEDGGRLKLVITDAGLAAIGVDTDEGTEASPATATAQPKKHKSRSRRSATGRQTKTEAPPAGVRPGTKQALLIDLLRRKDGATIGEIVDAIGWQPHSVRGAISGTLKKKLGLTVERAVVDDRGRVYRIAGRG
jgi:DNA-binding MarR family transcriptional regulator